MILPKHYEYLKNEPGPRILREALALYGTMEFKGAENNPLIIQWAKEVGGWISEYYKQDVIPWCGLFMAVCAKRAGFPFNQKALSAKEWASWGLPCEPALGCVLVFKRPGGHHVGLYVAEDDITYHVLGGNQSDAVTITRIYKSRMIASRECQWKVARPDNVRRIKIDSSGSISQNEA